MKRSPRFFVAILLLGGLAPALADRVSLAGDLPPSLAPPGPSTQGALAPGSHVLNPDQSLDYWDGRHTWRQLPDGRIYVWTDRHWVPGGAVFWGLNDGFGPPQQPTGFLDIGLRRGEYIRRYGADNYYRYGPGHFGNG